MATPGAPRRPRLPSPALVVASAALLVALGGTGYAAVTLARDSVGTVHLRANSVTSPKVRDGSLRVADLAPPARRALRGQAGPQGPAGTKGDKGDKGDPGQLTGVQIVITTSAYDSSPERTVLLDCPRGKRLVGGGAGVWSRAMRVIPNNVALTASHPYDDDSWLATAQEIGSTDELWHLHVHAICAPVS